MFKSIRDITEDIKYELSLVPGSAVDQFSEASIEQNIYNAYLFFFRKRNWTHLLVDHTATLDEQAGIITSDIPNLLDFQDIYEVRQAPFTKHDIVRPDLTSDPADIKWLCYRPLNFYHQFRASRALQFYPVDTSTSVKIYYKYGVSSLTADDVMPFPYDLIVHYICARMLAKDGINSEGQAEHEMLFGQIYEDLVVNSLEAKNLILGASTSDSFTVAGT